MIERIPFGRTGHLSSRTLFGAAALGGMRQEKADQVMEMFLARGLNHIDVAASYGDAEERLAPFLSDHRKEVFLATKTGDRDGPSARASLERSLTRMGVDQVDMIQMHNLWKDDEWETAMGPGGALEALIQARDEGLTRFIGVTGHGTYVAAAHLRSLSRFEFASVLLPYNYTMMQNPQYRADFDALYAECEEKQVAMQTIKAIARRRWRDDDEAKRFSWYMPIEDEQALRRAVHYTLAKPGLFLNTSSNALLLPAVLDAAEQMPAGAPSDAQMAQDAQEQGVEPLFVRDVSDDVMLGNL